MTKKARNFIASIRDVFPRALKCRCHPRPDLQLSVINRNGSILPSISVLKTAGSTLLACYIYDIVYNNDIHFTDRVQEAYTELITVKLDAFNLSISFETLIQSKFFKTLRLLPIIGPKIKDEVEKAKASVRKNKDLYNPSYLLELPAKSRTVDEMKIIIKGSS